MFDYYCDYSMNRMLAFGMFYQALASMLSPNYDPFYRTDFYTTPIFPSPHRYSPDNLVGDTLWDINLDSYNTYSHLDSLPDILATPPTSNQNQVGDSLMSILNAFNTAKPQYEQNLLQQSQARLQNQGQALFAPNYSSNVEIAEVDNGPVGTDASVIRTNYNVKPSKDIIKRVKQIAKKIKCNYKDLLGLMYCESSFRTVPTRWNGKSAVGLIQFTDICIKDINMVCGTHYTKQQIAQMNALQQLDLAEIALVRAKKIAGFPDSHKLTSGELYAMNYVPKNAKNSVVAQRGDGYYEGNEGLDIDKNGKITQTELVTRVEKGKLHVIC